MQIMWFPYEKLERNPNDYFNGVSYITSFSYHLAVVVLLWRGKNKLNKILVFIANNSTEKLIKLEPSKVILNKMGIVLRLIIDYKVYNV